MAVTWKKIAYYTDIPTPGTISQATVSGESIAAGNVVGIFRHGIRKGYGLKTGSAEIDQIGAAVTYVGVAWLTSTLLVLAYTKSADSKIYAVALTIGSDWTVTTAGAEATIANYVVSGLRVRRGSDSQFIVAWTDNASRAGRLFASACSVGGANAITVGSEAEINPSSSVYTSGHNSYDFKLLTTLTLIFAYRDIGTSNYLRACVVTWNADTLALTVNADVQIDAAAVDDVSLAVLTATRVHCNYERTGSAIYNALIKISGTTPSAGSLSSQHAYAVVAGTESCSVSPKFGFTAYALNNVGGVNIGVATLVYQYTALELPYQAYGDAFALTLAVKGIPHSIDEAVVVTFYDSGSAYISWSMSAMRLFKPLMFCTAVNIHAIDGDFSMDLDPSKTAFALFFNDAGDGPHFGHLLIYDIGKPIGIAMEANSGGTALKIAVTGEATITAWGLTPNRRHYAQMDGTLTTTPNGWPLLHAFSATEALMLLPTETL